MSTITRDHGWMRCPHPGRVAAGLALTLACACGGGGTPESGATGDAGTTLAEQTPESPGRMAAESRPGGLPRVDLCGLLTFDEIEAVTGIRPDATLRERMGPDSPVCTFNSQRELYPVGQVGLAPGAYSSWDDWTAAMIAAGWGDPSDDGERVDIGRFGHYRDGLLRVGTGRAMLTVLVNSSGRKARGKEGVIDLARLALARLP